MSDIKEFLPFLIPIAVIQLGMQLYSIVNLIRRHKVRFLNKPIWAVIIICFGIIGSGIYLATRGYDE